jgi:hypothetical protein
MRVAPYCMERMDDEYAKRALEAPVLKKKPSECVRSGKIYFSCEADEVKLVGENQIVYASDFPHRDHSYPASIDESATAATSPTRRSARSSPTTRGGSTSSRRHRLYPPAGRRASVLRYVLR